MKIADSLGTLKDLASKDPSAAEAAVANIDQNQMVEKWNALKVAGEFEYRPGSMNASYGSFSR